MPFYRKTPDLRRQIYLRLVGSIESQLRDAYAAKHEAGILNQSIVADKLGVDRAAVHRRLSGKCNMTIETLASMVWALEHVIDVKIFDPKTSPIGNHNLTGDENIDLSGRDGQFSVIWRQIGAYAGTGRLSGG
jgi:hypothetical protein